MRHKVKQHGLDWDIESAGTESYHIGEAPHRFSQKICKEHGIDISGQRAKKFTADSFAAYDKIYAMATDVYEEIKQIGGAKADMSKVSLFLNELSFDFAQGDKKKDDRPLSVPDPYYGGEEGYVAVYEMIDKTCDAIIRKYRQFEN